MNLDGRIKEERERLGFNQTAFAALANASKHSQINWEKGVGTPTAAVLAAWAEHGLDVLYVVTGQRDPATPALDQAEQVLLESYRRCTPQARQHLIQTAALLSAGMAAGGGATAQTQINHGSGAVQISGSRNRVTRK